VTRNRRARTADAAPAGRRRLTLVAPGASPEEAAAIVAALERYVADTQTPPASPPRRPSRWLRAALLEGVGRADRRRGAWGDPHS
jgi:hypothetical protein